MGIAEEKYIAFTTFRRSGDPVTTATWVAPVSDGRVGFWTAMGTGKTKRLRNNPAVEVQPANARGATRPGSTTQHGTAEMVQSGPLFDEVQAAIKKKYGVATKITSVLAKLGAQGRKGLTYADTVVLVRLDD